MAKVTLAGPFAGHQTFAPALCGEYLLRSAINGFASLETGKFFSMISRFSTVLPKIGRLSSRSWPSDWPIE